MSKPDTVPTWATDDDYDAPGTDFDETPTKLDPGAGQSAAGWAPGQRPPARWLNWWKHKVGEWLGWLNGHLGETGGGSLRVNGPLDLGGGVSVEGTPSYMLRSTQVFTADGTWTRPSDVRAVRVTVVAGGGGGGAAAATGTATATNGGGGGGGGAAIKLVTNPGSSEAVTVGAGGGGGTSGGSGSSGGASSFGSHCSATGGSGGSGMSDGHDGTASAAGGDGGEGSDGDLNLQGSPGDRGRVAIYEESSVYVQQGIGSGRGGGAYFGGGANSVQSGSPQVRDGNDGVSPGSGGSGSSAMGQVGNDPEGGAGADGIVIVEEYV